MASRGRPPHPGPLTPAEERVLACVREGMPNAEIAVRLGVSVNTVRYHVSNLLAKAGANSRQELGHWRPQRPRGGESHGHWWWPIGLARPVVLGIVGAVAVLSAGAFLFVPLPRDDVEPIELPEPFTRPDADELREQGFVDAGPLLETEGGGDVVLGHSPRALFTGVLLSAPAQFEELPGDVSYATFGTNDAHISRSRWLETSDGEFSVRVQSWSGQGENSIRTLDGWLWPVVFAWATNRAETETYRATFTPDGHAWVHPEPLSPGAVFDEWTGEQISVSASAAAGWLDPSPASILFTGCNEGRCHVSYRTHQPLLAPADGVLTCESPTRLLLDQGSIVLHIDWADTGFGGNPQFQCEPHHVRAGDRIGPERHYSLNAYDASAQQISLGITPDGHLYAGDFAPTIACPCRHGN